MFSRLAEILGAPRRAFALLSRGNARLAELTELVRRTRTAQEALTDGTHDTAHKMARLALKIDDVAGHVKRTRSELEALRGEVRDRLLQYNLQVGRLAHAVSARADSAPRRLTGRPLPASISAADAPGWEGIAEGAPHPDPDGREWLHLETCSACGCAERTVVSAFNKLIMMAKAPDDGSARYDYAICHACGILYATRRPFGERFKYLLAHFGEVTGKAGGSREIKNPLLNPYPLTDHDRAQLRQLASKGVFVSDHLGLTNGDYLEGLIKDRFENSVHADLLATLVAPLRGRVLEVRPRTGAIADALRRLFQAKVEVLPIWESQQFVLKEVYGLDSAALVDFDRFTVPGGEPFDVVVCNHMLTHAVRPGEFLRTVRTSLRPGGHLYLYNEPADAEFLEGPQSMIVTLNPLHMQAFDQRSLQRALAANGFEIVFTKMRNMNYMCLARAVDTSWQPMAADECTRRIESYRAARDRAVLRAPETVRARFAHEWSDIVARCVADGTLDFDEKGQLRLTT